MLSLITISCSWNGVSDEYVFDSCDMWGKEKGSFHCLLHNLSYRTMRNPQWLQLIKISPGKKCPQKWWKQLHQLLTVKSVAAITLNVVSIKVVEENFVFVQVHMAWFQMDSISVTIQTEISRTVRVSTLRMEAVGSSKHHYLPIRLYGVTFQMKGIFRHKYIWVFLPQPIQQPLTS